MVLYTIGGLLIGMLPYGFLLNPRAIRDSLPRAILVWIAVHLAVALGTQALDLFTYPVLVAIHLGIGALLFWYNRERLVNWRMARPECALVGVFVLALLFLLTPHGNYSGLVAHTTSEATRVTGWQYPYPYYSDEWYAIAFAEQSIETSNLPLTYPFTHVGVPFGNLEAAFHSLIAEIALLFDLTLLTQYVLLSAVINAGLVTLLYLLLRQLALGQAASAIAALSSLFVVNSANLPGLWTLLPMTVGTVTLLIMFISLARRDAWSTLGSSALTLLLYPPHVVFIAAALAVSLLTRPRWSSNERRTLVLGSAALLILAAAIVSSFYVVGSLSFERTAGTFFSHIIFSTIFYETFTPGGIPHYPPQVIIPLVTLLVALIGMFQLPRRVPWLFAVLLLGLGYWLLYSQVTWRFIIEYQRALFVTSLVVVVTSGFGWQWLLDSIVPRFQARRTPIRQWHLLVGIAAIFLALLPGYTARTDWQQLVLVNQATGEQLTPAAPANDYLQQGDLDLFASLTEQRFLSVPWKGTVLGVATSNHPLTTKTGTLSLEPELIFSFLQADCGGRQSIVEDYTIDYVYVPPFNCPDFIPQGEGADGLWLYATARAAVN